MPNSTCINDWGGLIFNVVQAINYLKGEVSILSQFKSVLCLCGLYNYNIQVFFFKVKSFKISEAICISFLKRL